jgi:hypothetical protein
MQTHKNNFGLCISRFWHSELVKIFLPAFAFALALTANTATAKNGKGETFSHESTPSYTPFSHISYININSRNAMPCHAHNGYGLWSTLQVCMSLLQTLLFTIYWHSCCAVVVIMPCFRNQPLKSFACIIFHHRQLPFMNNECQGPIQCTKK